jgi:hypothetical protein
METLRFKQMPLIVKISVGLIFNNVWWSMEEFVINRNGLWKYMPYYKVNDACVWDLTVAPITIVAIWLASRGSKTPETLVAEH